MRLFCFLFLLAELVFPLVAGELKITVLSDLHVTPGNGNDKLMPRVVDEVNANDSDLVVVDGDLTNRGADAELRHIHQLLSKIEKPLYVIPGNHETNWSESAGLLFSGLWGDDRFAIKRKGVVLIGFASGPYLKMGNGYIRSEDVVFLKHSLKTLAGHGEPVIVFCHYPLAPELGNGPAIAGILHRYNVIAFVSGHTHRQFRRWTYGIDNVVCRALTGGGTHGYDLLVFDGEKTLQAFEKRIGEKELFPFEQFKTVEEKPFPRESPLPEGVAVELLHADRSSVFTGVAVSDRMICYGTSDGRLVVLGKDGKLLWEKQFGLPFYSTPVIFGKPSVIGVGMTGVPGGKGGGGCVALIPAAGPPDERGVRLIPTPGPVIGGGTVSGGNCYIGGGKSEFLRIGGDGRVLTRRIPGLGTTQGRPAVGGGRVVFGAWDTHLYALDAATLEPCWKWSNGKPEILYSPGNVVPVIGGGQVIIVAPDRYMTALDLVTGKPVWRNRSFRFRESLGTGEGGAVAYAKTMDGLLVAVSTGSRVFRTRWVCDLKFGYDHASCPVLELNGVVYAGSRDGVIAAVDAAFGKLLWRFRGGDSEVNGFTAGPDGSVYATLIEGKIYRITSARGR